MRKKPTAFPVGLYGMLLFALCWLTLPGVFAPLERCVVGAACGTARLFAQSFGAPALAASESARQPFVDLAEELHRRVLAHDVPGSAPPWQRGLEPVHCAVVGVSRRGGGGEPSELLLERSYAELLGCVEMVTKGDALLGFLPRPGAGIAVDDEPGDLARVALLNHTGGRALHAEVLVPGAAPLRCVLRPASTVDPAPLRVDLWNDPYRAARLDRGDLPVVTREPLGSASGVPAGLRLGGTRLWGYPGADDDSSLTLDVFVTPDVVARSLSHVVLWRPAAAGAPRTELRTSARPRTAVPRPGVVHDLPGAVHGRHLLVGGGEVPDGAAVVQGGYLLGTARGLAFGTALVTSFAASRHRWSLVLLPDDPALPPRELDGTVAGVDGEAVHVRCRTGRLGERLPAGNLFTGSNGLHCPSGLWIGRAEPHALELGGLSVRGLVAAGPREVEVYAAEVPR